MSEPRRIRIGGTEEERRRRQVPYTLVEGESLFDKIISMLLLVSVIERISGATGGGTVTIDTGELQRIINDLRGVVDELEEAAEPVIVLADIIESFPQLLDELRALAARKLYLAEIDVVEERVDVMSLSARVEARDDYRDIMWNEMRIEAREDRINIKAEFKVSILEGESETGATALLRW